MKKIIISTLLTFVAVVALAQQNDKLDLALKAGLARLDTSKTTDQYTSTANYFERIATAEPNQWLPSYYTAYSLLLSGISSKQDEETRDAIYEKAMAFTEKADKLKPASSEVMALQGYIVFMQMAVSPQARAMSMIPRSNALLEKAIAANPENPRAYLLKGQNLFYTPEMFGGSKTDAKEVLLVALKKFETGNSNSPEPSWGKRRCNELLDQLK